MTFRSHALLIRGFFMEYQTHPRWVEIAESLQPTLHRTEYKPVEIVSVQADAASFQGWKMVPEAPLSALSERVLGQGDEFVLDFGQHLVGYFHFVLETVRIPDS